MHYQRLSSYLKCKFITFHLSSEHQVLHQWILEANQGSKYRNDLFDHFLQSLGFELLYICLNDIVIITIFGTQAFKLLSRLSDVRDSHQYLWGGIHSVLLTGEEKGINPPASPSFSICFSPILQTSPSQIVGTLH